MNYVFQIAFLIPAVLIAITVHEFSHGLVSYWLGDPTPKDDGRLTLNPARHIDVFGLISLMLFHVGWAKPIRINSEYYKNPKWGTVLVALAGPLSNFIVAFISGLFGALALHSYSLSGSGFSEALYYIFQNIVILNLGLGIFNLIPLPPLDGSRILQAFLPYNARRSYLNLERYSMWIILGLLLLMDVISMFGLLNPIDYLLNVIYKGFTTFWLNLVF